MNEKDYTLTCGEVIDNLLMLADAYEKASAGKAPSGFAFNPTDAAANMKAAAFFIGSFGQQVPRWIPVTERLPPNNDWVLGFQKWIPDVYKCDEGVLACWYWHSEGAWKTCEEYDTLPNVTHWMPMPAEPSEAK